MSDPDPITFRQHSAAPDVRPPWHGGEDGDRWHFAMSVVKDGMLDAAQMAARCRLISLCADDALAYHGESLGWPRAPGETADSYRKRLLRSPELEEWRGTNEGIVRGLKALLESLGYTSDALYWIEVKSSWTPDWGRQKTPGPGINPARARWINVIVRQPHPFGTDFGFRWGDGTKWGDAGKNYGVNGDQSLLEVVRQVVRRQKSAHSYVEWVALVLAGDVIDGTGTTNDGKPDGSGARVAYLKVR